MLKPNERRLWEDMDVHKKELFCNGHKQSPDPLEQSITIYVDWTDFPKHFPDSEKASR